MTALWKALTRWCCLVLLTGFVPARAALQFDVFCGYDGTVHESAWFPITCEIFNDGPSFNAVIEISGSGSDQVHQVPIELPTNTRKRLVIPMYSSGGRYNAGRWNARLVDTGGKVRAERLDQQTKLIPWEVTLLGGIPRNFGGLPIYPDVPQQRRDLRPEVARIQPEQFPDNPIALEGLNAFYVNSEKAIDFNANQVGALLGWVRGGGHLIIAVEQISDINATPWLKQFSPMELTGVENRAFNKDIVAWLKRDEPAARTATRRVGRANQFEAEVDIYKNLPSDDSYRESEMPVATGTLRDGVIVISGEKGPLAVQAPRGRGKLTLLTFSPEREPFRSWKNRNYFWAKLTDVPPETFSRTDYSGGHGGFSSDGIFGALIDSRQIKKLPVTWLLVLLLVYLVVIGPFDQWWLKKIGRQMLTWVTFPAYVVLFSLLIYFIGYKLRAGETEWNELNIVDLLPRADKVDMRGRSFVSIYSSGNAWYKLSGPPGYAAFRTEMTDVFRGRNDSSRFKVAHVGNSYKGELFVPVWTSLLFVNDWFRTNDTPFVASVSGTESSRTVEIRNLLDRPLKTLRVVVDERLHEVGDIEPGQTQTYTLTPDKGTPLANFVQQNGSYFQRAAEIRQNPLGSDSSGGHLEDRPLTAVTASFPTYLDEVYQGGQRGFISPPGLDLSPQVKRGDAVVFAWLPEHTFNGDINQFKPLRFKRDTLLRLVIPVKKADPTI